MGKKFDSLINSGVTTPIKKYLLEKGFREDIMNPRYMNGFCYNELTLNKKCMRFDTQLANEDYLTIFINDVDIYYETEKPYRSYGISDRLDATDYPDIEDIDKLLDRIVERVS